MPFPEIDPVALQIGPLAIRWYALSYIAGLLLGWRYAVYLARRPEMPIPPTAVEPFLTWAVIGVIVGGRLGFVLFYGLPWYWRDPLSAFAVWEGGMSFHGGMIGVAVAGLLYCRINRLSASGFGDLLAAVAPIGLFLGRIANFINGELYGRPTQSPLGMVFPGTDGQPRHPSQLYEAALEGLLLFVIINLVIRRFDALRRPGLVMGVFIAGYGVSRFIVEFFRQWDAGLSLAFGWLSRGQQLSIPMILIGFWFIMRALRSPRDGAPV